MKGLAFIGDQALMLQSLRKTIEGVERGDVIAVACVEIERDGGMHPWWGWILSSLPEGARGLVMRGAVAYLAAKMDALALED